jgi:hypothetical protein
VERDDVRAIATATGTPRVCTSSDAPTTSLALDVESEMRTSASYHVSEEVLMRCDLDSSSSLPTKRTS